VALTDDQKAMLRLLAQREQGYDDIAALTGQGVEEVRAKVRDALAALEGGGAPAGDQKAMLRLLAQREEGYDDIAALTGESIEGVRAKVGAALARLDGDTPTTAAGEPSVEPQPEGSAPTPPKPKAESPKAPAPPKAIAPEPPEAPVPPEAPGARGAAGSRLKLPADRGAVLGLGAGLAVVLILVILLATGVLGGSGESATGSAGAESESSPAGDEGSKSGLKPTQAILEPVGGGDASGRALFAKSKKQVVLLVRAKGLEPAPKGKSYTISLSKSPTERLPLVATQVNKSGEVVGSFPVAPQVLGLLASGFDEMELSIVADGELSSALEAAKQAKAPPDYRGTDVLRGPVTGAIVEAGETGKVKP
jgi:hypothetical protein